LPHLSQWRYTKSVVEADQSASPTGKAAGEIEGAFCLSAWAETRSEAETFRFVLRRETRAEHDELDGHPAFAALIGGKLSFDGYRSLMLAFHGFYSDLDKPLEQACDQFGLDRLGFRYEPRTAILASDLAMLGADAPTSSNGRPAGRHLRLDSIEALGGALYVFEGSLLGASVLCASTDALMERTGSRGNAYWKWCREAAPKRWAMTCRLIEGLATTDHAKGPMIGGAKMAFRSFATWLDNWNDALLQGSRNPC
jgi:heme oxygenase